MFLISQSQMCCVQVGNKAWWTQGALNSPGARFTKRYNKFYLKIIVTFL